MELRLVFDGNEAGRKIKHNMDQMGKQVREAMRKAAEDAAQEIMARGADDIQGAGNFGERWQDALDSQVTETQRTLRVETTMMGGPPVSYWRVFEYGADISAKNPSGLMWLPWGLDKSRTDGLWPRAYGMENLFRVKNVLFDRDSMQPMYFGTPSVHIPQKFHLRDIIMQVSRELKSYYAEHMRG
jgi:hypothetical protein